MNASIILAIKNRRSMIRFESTPIEDETIQQILDVGRWAPSWLNQPRIVLERSV